MARPVSRMQMAWVVNSGLLFSSLDVLLAIKRLAIGLETSLGVHRARIHSVSEEF